jgi:hypothetical protein
MATPSKRLPIIVDIPASTPRPSLDDEFLPMIARLAAAPVRLATQEGPGLLRDDGLSADAIRALAGRWCRADRQRARFDADALDGLAMALLHYEDHELGELIEGAIVMYGTPGI